MSVDWRNFLSGGSVDCKKQLGTAFKAGKETDIWYSLTLQSDKNDPFLFTGRRAGGWGSYRE